MAAEIKSQASKETFSFIYVDLGRECFFLGRTRWSERYFMFAIKWMDRIENNIRKLICCIVCRTFDICLVYFGTFTTRVFSFHQLSQRLKYLLSFVNPSNNLPRQNWISSRLNTMHVRKQNGILLNHLHNQNENELKRKRETFSVHFLLYDGEVLYDHRLADNDDENFSRRSKQNA